MNSSHDAVVVGWSGGWDSTFRVLELVIRHNCTVQPVYMVDRERRSLDNEIRAMDAIREMVMEMFPHCSDLILPTHYIEAESLVAEESDAQKYEYLSNRYHVAKQYIDVATAGRKFGYDSIELMVHGNDTDTMWQFLRDHAQLTHYPCGAPTYRLGEWGSTNEFEESMQLFSLFTYPTINTEKPQMGEIAREYGFLDILERSWFCHMPWGDQPCGMCRPCRYVIYDGLQKRFPPAALLRYRVWWVLHPARVLVQEPGGTFRRIGTFAKLIWKKLHRE